MLRGSGKIYRPIRGISLLATSCGRARNASAALEATLPIANYGHTSRTVGLTFWLGYQLVT